MDDCIKIRWNSGRKLCDCANCAQGKWTKEQYAREIRTLCSRLQPKASFIHKELRPGSCINKETIRKSYSSNYSSPARRPVDISLKNSRKTSINSGSISQAYHKNLVNHLTWAEQTIHENTAKTKDMIYYIDEEQPHDIEAYSDMVNGRSTDPRILPAMVQTIRHLRQGYHEMLLDMKPKSRDFFDREFAKLERNRFYTREQRNSSPEESDSGATDCSDGRYFVTRKSPQSMKSPKNDRSYYDSDLSHSRSDSGVTLSNGDNASKHAVNHLALRTAALNGETDLVMYLTLHGYDLNYLGEDGWPAVDSALRKSRFRCAIFLIEAGTNMSTYTAKKIEEYIEMIYKCRNHLHIVQTSL